MDPVFLQLKPELKKLGIPCNWQSSSFALVEKKCLISYLRVDRYLTTHQSNSQRTSQRYAYLLLHSADMLNFMTMEKACQLGIDDPYYLAELRAKKARNIFKSVLKSHAAIKHANMTESFSHYLQAHHAYWLAHKEELQVVNSADAHENQSKELNRLDTTHYLIALKLKAKRNLHHYSNHNKSASQIKYIYKKILSEAHLTTNRAEQFSIAIELSLIYAACGRRADAKQSLVKCVKHKLIQSKDQAIVFYISRANIYFDSGDLYAAVVDISVALELYRDNLASVSQHSNLMLLAAKYHLYIGNIEIATALLREAHALLPRNIKSFSQDSNLLYIATLIQSEETGAAATAMTELVETVSQNSLILDGNPYDFYMQMSAELQFIQYGAEAAVSLLNEKTNLAQINLLSLEHYDFTLFLDYCFYRIEADPRADGNYGLVATACCAYEHADKIHRWRIPTLAATFLLATDRAESAIIWAQLACREILELNAPLLYCEKQRNLLINKWLQPFEVLCNCLVLSGNLPQAHEIRQQQKLLQSSWTIFNNDQTRIDSTMLKELDLAMDKTAEAFVIKWKLANNLMDAKLDRGMGLQRAIEKSELCHLVFTMLNPRTNKLYQLLPEKQLIAKGVNSSIANCDVVNLEYFQDHGRFSANIRVGTVQCSHTLECSVAEISSLVFQLREQLQDNTNCKAIAYQLFMLLFEPLRHSLGSASSVSITSVGVLQHLPFAVLFDGEAYLAQKIQLLYGPSPMAYQRKLPLTANVLMIGTSSHSNHSAKLNPVNELAVIEQFFPIEHSLLDGFLDTGNLALALKNKPALVHLCCHFDFAAHSPNESSLLLSNERQMSMTDFIGDDNYWDSVHLLFLGACNTGTELDAISNAIDQSVENSFAKLLALAGVDHVIATLWSVVDEDNLDFIKIFYQHLHETRNVSVAFQRTQRHFIEEGEFHWAAYRLWTS